MIFCGDFELEYLFRFLLPAAGVWAFSDGFDFGEWGAEVKRKCVWNVL
jgi:hypothetical protein